MRRLALICLLCISLLSVGSVSAQHLFPTTSGERVKYAAYIEMPRAYISGISVLVNEQDTIRGSLFNEFGITAMDFSFDPKKHKVKLHHVIPAMDKWYIRRVLRKDLAQLMIHLQNGKTQYTNERRHINYQFTPISDETKE